MIWLCTYNHSHSDEREQAEDDLHRSGSHFDLDSVDSVWRERKWDPFSTVGGATANNRKEKKALGEFWLHVIYRPTFLWFSFCVFSKVRYVPGIPNQRPRHASVNPLTSASLSLSLALSLVFVFWGLKEN